MHPIIQLPLAVAVGIFLGGAAAAQTNTYGFGGGARPDALQEAQLDSRDAQGREGSPSTAQGGLGAAAQPMPGAPPTEETADETKRRVEESIREARKAVRDAQADIGGAQRTPDTSLETRVKTPQ